MGVFNPTPPGGSDKEIQFNDVGDFNGDAALTFDKTGPIFAATFTDIYSWLGDTGTTDPVTGTSGPAFVIGNSGSTSFVFGTASGASAVAFQAEAADSALSNLSIDSGNVHLSVTASTTGGGTSQAIYLSGPDVLGARVFLLYPFNAFAVDLGTLTNPWKKIYTLGLQAIGTVQFAELDLGFDTDTMGVLKFYNDTNSNTTTFQSGIAAASVTYTWPTNVGADTFLKCAADGTLSWGAAGTGTVTSVSVVTANGVSGSVATATTTPAITLTLGAITPTTVNGNTISTGTGTLTLGAGATLATSATNSITLTSTGATNVTLPTSGTLAILGANTFTAKQTITQASANAGIIGSTGYSLTGSDASNMLDFAGTLNTSGNPVALKLSLTNTGSGATTKFVSFLAGAAGTTEMVSVGINGTITTATVVAGFINRGVLTSIGGRGNGGYWGASTAEVGWVSTGNVLTGTKDTALGRDAAGVVGVFDGNTTSAYRDIKLRNLVSPDANGSYIQHPGMAVANLPATPVRGMRCYVTDSNAASYTAGIGAVVAAGGATVVPVFYDGTNWRIG